MASDLPDEHASALLSSVGAVREGLAVLQTLGELIRSPRMGAKQVKSALDSFRESGAEFLVTLSTAVGHASAICTSPNHASAEALGGIHRGVVTQFHKLSEQIASQSWSLRAKERLQLEGTVRETIDQLTDLSMVIELLAAAEQNRVSVVDLEHMLDRHVEGDVDRTEPFSANAQLISGWIRWARRVSGHPESAVVSAMKVASVGGDGFRIAIDVVVPNGKVRRTSATVEVASSIVQRAGYELEISEERTRLLV